MQTTTNLVAAVRAEILARLIHGEAGRPAIEQAERVAQAVVRLGHWSKLAGYLLASAAHSRRDGVPAAMRPSLLVPNTRHAGIAVYRVTSTKLKTLYRSLSLPSLMTVPSVP